MGFDWRILILAGEFLLALVLVAFVLAGGIFSLVRLTNPYRKENISGAQPSDQTKQYTIPGQLDPGSPHQGVKNVGNG